MSVPTEPLRYRAFISYSHRDSAVTATLHRRLEGFRVPRGLRATSNARELPARLHPVFRDRDELASSARLSQSIQAALDESEALVVVCSPAAVASPWVGEEISYFRRTHPDRPVFAFVVAGDPSLDCRRDPDRAALPLALALEDPLQPEGARGEPLAADARAEGDGFAHAFLKLVAGLLGVRYDDLRRRDQKRRQQRWAIALAAAFSLTAVFAYLAWEATRARDEARAAQARVELELRSEQQTREFLISVFQLADANEARGNAVTVREVLDRAVQRIDRAEFDRPAVRARFLATLGQAYSSLGLNRRGAELLQQSMLGIQASASDPDARRQQVDSAIELADTYFDMGEYESALAVLDRAEKTGLDPLQRVRTANVRGDVLSYLERDPEAATAYREAMSLADGSGADAAFRDAARARSLAGLATLSLFAGDGAAAERDYAEAIALLERSAGADHPSTINATISLGSAAYRAGRRVAAREAWERALALAERVFEPGGPQAGTLRNNLGRMLLEDGDLAAAEPLLRSALASDREHRSDRFDDLAYPLHNLGYLLLVRGERDEAESLLREALPIAESSQHRMLGPILAALADLRCAVAADEEARALAQRAVEASRNADGADAWYAALARLTAAACSARAGEIIDRSAARRDLDAVQAKWGSASPFARRAQAQFDALPR
jgi:Tfp pilus assembly protein PilF